MTPRRHHDLRLNILDKKMGDRMALQIRHFASGVVLTAFSALLPLEAFAQSVTRYSYDAQGRLIGTQQGEGVTSGYTFDAASNRSRVTVTPQFPTAWLATSSSLGHNTGRAEGGGWAAVVSDPAGAMIYGPYTPAVPAGAHVAAFRMMVDNNTADNLQVVLLDVWDATASQQLAARQLTRMEWKAAFAYQIFELPFVLDASRAGHALEFRVWYQQTSYVRVERVGYR